MTDTVLIADSGSTKTDWWYEGTTFRSPGLNPYFLTSEEIRAVLRDEMPSGIKPTQIHFYGAGATAEKCPLLREILCSRFPAAEVVNVASDMLGAARALSGNAESIVCILGTGSNSCHYNGTEIVRNIPPLGYILGDEGSGAVLGRLFVGALLKDHFPPDLKESFLARYRTTQAEILDRVYRAPFPNRYLASFAPFISECSVIPEVGEMVVEALCLFLSRNVKKYEQYATLPVHFVGSVAHYFEDSLREACLREGVTPGKILSRPIECLALYHLSNK